MDFLDTGHILNGKYREISAYPKGVLHIQAEKSSVWMNYMLIHTTHYLRLSALKYIKVKVCLQVPYMGNTWRQETCTSIG
jgi:hypothetical protein